MRLHYAEDMPITARPRWVLKSQDSRRDHPLSPGIEVSCVWHHFLSSWPLPIAASGLPSRQEARP
jgi:hypothetical protein